MKITDTKLRQLTGVIDVDGQWVEDRMARPTDVYEEFRKKGRIGRSGSVRTQCSTPF